MISIGNVAINVSDLERSERFYVDGLGLQGAEHAFAALETGTVIGTRPRVVRRDPLRQRRSPRFGA